MLSDLNRMITNLCTFELTEEQHKQIASKMSWCNMEVTAADPNDPYKDAADLIRDEIDAMVLADVVEEAEKYSAFDRAKNIT